MKWKCESEKICCFCLERKKCILLISNWQVIFLIMCFVSTISITYGRDVWSFPGVVEWQEYKWFRTFYFPEIYFHIYNNIHSTAEKKALNLSNVYISVCWKFYKVFHPVNYGTYGMWLVHGMAVTVYEQTLYISLFNELIDTNVFNVSVFLDDKFLFILYFNIIMTKNTLSSQPLFCHFDGVSILTLVPVNSHALLV